LSPAEWEQLHSDVARRCEELRSGDPVDELNSATGVAWCDCGIPGKVPPTLGTRDLEQGLRRLPRRLRRHWRRASNSWDGCGALDVLGILCDADATVIGEDRRSLYVDYLLTVGYGAAVARFLCALYRWLVGADEDGWDAACLSMIASLADAAAASVERLTLGAADPFFVRPPPMHARPSVTRTGPPSSVAAVRFFAEPELSHWRSRLESTAWLAVA
jgi:hypothetical protein